VRFGALLGGELDGILARLRETRRALSGPGAVILAGDGLRLSFGVGFRRCGNRRPALRPKTPDPLHEFLEFPP
jgi:hypothetical protein